MVGPKKQSEVKKSNIATLLTSGGAKCMGSLIVHQPSSFCRIRQLHGSLGSGTAHLAGNVSAWKENQCTPLRAVGTEANYQHYRFYIMHAYDEFHVCNRLRRFSWRGGSSLERNERTTHFSVSNINVSLHMTEQHKTKKRRNPKKVWGKWLHRKTERHRYLEIWWLCSGVNRHVICESEDVSYIIHHCRIRREKKSGKEKENGGKGVMLKVRLQTHKAGPEASSRNIRYSQPSARPHSTNDSCVHRSGDEHADKEAHTQREKNTVHTTCHGEKEYTPIEKRRKQKQKKTN